MPKAAFGCQNWSSKLGIGIRLHQFHRLDVIGFRKWNRKTILCGIRFHCSHTPTIRRLNPPYWLAFVFAPTKKQDTGGLLSFFLEVCRRAALPSVGEPLRDLSPPVGFPATPSLAAPPHLPPPPRCGRRPCSTCAARAHLLISPRLLIATGGHALPTPPLLTSLRWDALLLLLSAGMSLNQCRRAFIE
jgi:hypothetical protein